MKVLDILVAFNKEKAIVGAFCFFEYFAYPMTIRQPSPPDSIEHGIGFLVIKIPSANRRFLESNNGARKSHADLGHIS